MKRIYVPCLIVALLVLIPTFSGCFPKLVSIYISPSSADLTVGETKDFAVHGIFSDGSEELLLNATWQYSGEGGSISPSYGARTTFTADEEGDGKIWAYDSSGNLDDSAAISVESQASNPVLTRIEVSPSSWTMNEGTTKTFTATGYDQYDEVFSINPTWSTTGGIGSVSPSTGTSTTLTASMVASNTSGTIKASVGLINDSASVTVINIQDPPVLTRIEISPSSWTMQQTTTKAFSATGYDQYNNTMAISPTWSINGHIGRLSTSSGTSTTFTAECVGSGTIRATQAAISDTSTINVTQSTSSLANAADSLNGGNATASSWGSYMGYDALPQEANDGSLDTFWAGTSVPDWCMVEFNNTYTIEEVRVITAGHTQTYNIQLSTDGISWTTVATHTSPDTDSDNGSEPRDDYRISIADQDAKYIRVNITSTDAPYSHIYQAILQEIQAFTSDSISPSSGVTELRNDIDVFIPDLGTITDKLHFDAVSSIPSDAIITEAYFECKIDHSWMMDLHIDVAHNTMIWTEFDPLNNITPQTFSCYIPEWVGRSAKFDAVLWVRDEAARDDGSVYYWRVRISWTRP